MNKKQHIIKIKIDQVKQSKTQSRNIFNNVDMRTRVKKSKKVYSRKLKHRKIDY